MHALGQGFDAVELRRALGLAAQSLFDGGGKFDGQGRLQHHHRLCAQVLAGHLDAIGGVGIDHLAQLDPHMDWALVEGFKQGDLPKIELWRAPAPGQPVRPLQCLSDPSVLALATDAPQQLPQPLPTQVALLDLNAPEAIVAWMLAQGERLQYVPPKTP